MTHVTERKTASKLATMALLAPLAGLTACTSSSSSDTSGATASGVVYDGYLQNARVCVDVNLNKQCDDGEPISATDADGKFSIAGLNEDQALRPLLAVVGAGTTDADNGNAVDPNLKFSAPPKSEAVSALSTIVQSRVETALASGSSETISQLKQKFSTQLATDLGLPSGFDDPLSYDPIAAKNDESASDADRLIAAKTHLVNKVLSRQVATLNGNTGGTTAGFNASIKKLNAQDVRNAVENDTSGLALADIATAVAEQVTSEAQPAVPSQQEIQQAEQEQQTLKNNYDKAVEEETGGTGATGGTGGSGTS
ncbi:hypothetical protein C8D92_108167 [Tamilnaduibacter salinus]|uniref:Uncharacterized protein n=1 Tax=Tamilnaduibacter salinus TaxID=1484056 RepID=A0A2U1CUT4_9GAMM|nr:hypothetical protein [Tamilnaduibacter salinus]PVY70810.1 hypothetical protein C8D92_108167 [Tamilnaduibacter salinus]